MTLPDAIRSYAEPFKQADGDIEECISEMTVSDAREYAYILDRAAAEIERLQKEVVKRVGQSEVA